ncbi:MAG TPA: redoxin domain-containing protein [Solirubrobacterales bacterium]|nr:redoxin domain-containing protein [Solirubrobacterales bacterium]
MEAEGRDESGRRWPRVRRLLAIAVVILFLGLLAYGLLSKATNKAIDESLANGTAPPAPGFELPVLEPGRMPAPLERRLKAPLAGTDLSLAELRGTPFVLNFWASWCVPCREEAPILERGWRRFGPRGVLFLGLNMQDLTDDARSFLEEFKITYPTIRDQGNDVAHSYGVTGVPETYFVSARGRVVDHVIGAVDPSLLASGANAALRGRIVGTASGGAQRPQR